MQSKCTKFMSVFAKLALSLILSFTVLAGAFGQKVYADGDLSAVAQSGTHEIACICDNCNQDEPDDTDIEEELKLIGETDDAALRPAPHGQG